MIREGRQAVLTLGRRPLQQQPVRSLTRIAERPNPFVRANIASTQMGCRIDTQRQIQRAIAIAGWRAIYLLPRGVCRHANGACLVAAVGTVVGGNAD